MNSNKPSFLKFQKYINNSIRNINSSRGGIAGQKAEIVSLSLIANYYLYPKRSVCVAFQEFYNHFNQGDNESQELAKLLEKEMNSLKCDKS